MAIRCPGGIGRTARTDEPWRPPQRPVPGCRRGGSGSTSTRTSAVPIGWRFGVDLEGPLERGGRGSRFGSRGGPASRPGRPAEIRCRRLRRGPGDRAWRVAIASASPIPAQLAQGGMADRREHPIAGRARPGPRSRAIDRPAGSDRATVINPSAAPGSPQTGSSRQRSKDGEDRQAPQEADD